MKALKTIINRATDAYRVLSGGVPQQGRLTGWDPRLDSVRPALTPKLTFQKINDIIERGREGDLGETIQTFEEMIQRDPRLKSVSRTRRLAVTGLEYQILSAADVREGITDKALADEAAAYVREKFDDLQCDCALKHLATAIGPNLAVLEIEWNGVEIADIFPVHANRLNMLLGQSDKVLVRTADNLIGMPAESPKFVVHVPESVSGSPLAGGLLEAQAFVWLIKKLSLQDWATFCELFGMPIRWAKHQPGATPEEKKLLEKMLRNMGSQSWAYFSSNIEFELKEVSNRGISPYEAILNFCNKEQSVLWLGGNLTSDTTGGTGTFAAAEVQDAVRDDIRNDDLRIESDTIRNQIIAPMVEFRFPGRNAPLPYFQRVKPETVDRIKEATAIKAAQGCGILVPRKWAYKRLEIPEPNEGDDVLEPADAFSNGVGEGATNTDANPAMGN